MGKRVLFVDDEHQILKAINRLFINSDLEIYLAGGGDEALTILEKQPVDIMVTDMRMPGMDGYKLLGIVKEKYPNTMRLIVSGYADERLIFKAMENGYARMYMLKPWDNDQLKNTIDQMLQMKEILEDKKLLPLISSAGKLPTMPGAYNRLCKLIESEANMSEVAKVIEEDQSIAAEVLRIANTAFFGARTGSIRQAVMYLGLSNLKNIVLSSTVFSNYNFGSSSGIFKKELLWQHASTTNILVNVLYERILHKRVADVFASAGLLHDIGKLLLMSNFSADYEKVIHQVKVEKNKSFEDAESHYLDVTHEEVGGYLLNWWGLPHPMVEAALFHHSPLSDKVVNKELVAVVHLADYYSWDYMEEKIFKTIDVGVFSLLGTSQGACQNIVQELKHSQQS